MGIDPTIYKLIEVALRFTVEQVSTGSSLFITQPLQNLRDMINKNCSSTFREPGKMSIFQTVHSKLMSWLFGWWGGPVYTVFMTGDQEIILLFLL